jgi:hypothetical protein
MERFWNSGFYIYMGISRLVLRAARLFLLRWAWFVARSRRVRSGPGGHVRLLGPWPTSAGRFYLEREGCCALRRNGALPIGSDLLGPHILCRSLLAFVPRPLRHLVLVWDTRHLRRLGQPSCAYRRRLSLNPLRCAGQRRSRVPMVPDRDHVRPVDLSISAEKALRPAPHDLGRPTAKPGLD